MLAAGTGRQGAGNFRTCSSRLGARRVEGAGRDDQGHAKFGPRLETPVPHFRQLPRIDLVYTLKRRQLVHCDFEPQFPSDCCVIPDK